MSIVTDDAASDSHSYLSHYASETLALERLAAIIRRIVTHAARLPNGRRHVVLTEGIVAMYLSTPGVKTPRIREKTRTLTHASGPLTKLLLVVAHVWRATRAREVSSSDAPNGLPPGMPVAHDNFDICVLEIAISRTWSDVKLATASALRTG